MRRRIVIATLPLLALLVLAVVVPAAGLLAQRHTAEMITDRMVDASRFSAIAQQGLESEPARLSAELDAYAELYDTRLWLISRDRDILHSSAPEDVADTAQAVPEAAAALITSALSGTQSESTQQIFPWGPRSLLLVTPIGHDSEVSAALVMEFPTDSAREQILWGWIGIAAGAAVPAAALLLGILPMAAWVLKPLRRLEGSIQRIRAGAREAPAPDDTGPAELRDFARSFNAMQQTVRHSLERQEQFASDASHQLRNPLASMQIGLDNLAPYLRREQEAQEAFQEAQQTVQRMNVLVDDLLTASLHQLAEPVSTRVDIGELADTEWRRLCEQAGAELEVSLTAAQLPEPPGGFETLISELIGNALKTGQVSRVRISGARSTVTGDYLIDIDDDGAGLTREELTQVGTRLWRSPKHQNTPGSGLGLHITAQILADIGAQMQFKPSELGGLKVRLVFPDV